VGVAALGLRHRLLDVGIARTRLAAVVAHVGAVDRNAHHLADHAQSSEGEVARDLCARTWSQVIAELLDLIYIDCMLAASDTCDDHPRPASRVYSRYLSDSPVRGPLTEVGSS